jgi:Protein of unknown function (DUF3592)
MASTLSRVEAMFDLVFTLLQAYNKIMLVMGGAFCGLIGAVISLYPVYVHYGARRYRGEVLGLRQDGNVLWPVIAYTDEDGERHEALGTTGSSTIPAVPGMPVDIMVKPGQPDRCTSAGFGWIELAGVAFLVPGILLARSGLKDFPVNWLSILVTLALVGYLGARIFRGLHPLLAAMKGTDWRQESEQAARERQQWPLLPASEIAARVTTQDRNARRALPWVFVIGLALIAGGAWWGQHRTIFMATAAVADGRVVGGEWSGGSGSSSPTYHAIIRFSDAGGRSITYRDDIGTNPPSFRIGETVRIYYDPERPENALIDRGLWNWLLPLLVALGGVLLLLGGLTQYRKIRSRAAYLGPAPEAAGA